MADMTPIERAARALYDSAPAMRDHFTRANLRPEVEPIAWDELAGDERRPYFVSVRAVIAAIREPSEETLLALRAQIQNVSDREDEVWNFVFDTLMAD